RRARPPGHRPRLHPARRRCGRVRARRPRHRDPRAPPHRGLAQRLEAALTARWRGRVVGRRIRGLDNMTAGGAVLMRSFRMFVAGVISLGALVTLAPTADGSVAMATDAEMCTQVTLEGPDLSALGSPSKFK